MTKKSLIIAIAALCSLALCSQAASPRKQLLQRLEQLLQQGIMLGHQDDPLYGRSWCWQQGRSDVLETIGDYPAVMGFELGQLELDSARNLDGVPFSLMRQEILAQHCRGGIISICWHPSNPATGQNAWSVTPGIMKELLPGGKYNDKFNGWLTRVGNFLGSLKDEQGRSIPMIFRPWHEMNGTWFWWGVKGGTEADYQALYRYTHQFLTKKCKLNNLAWAYSPNLADAEAQEHYLSFYPGDKYVDLLGIDVYDFNDDAAYAANLVRELDVLQAVGKQHGKLVALTETGAQQVPTPNWFTQVLGPIIKGRPLVYVLLWRNAWDQPKEYYVPTMGHPAGADFIKWAAQPSILTLKNLQQRKTCCGIK